MNTPHCAHLTIHFFIGFGNHKALLPIPTLVCPHISMDTLLGYTIKAKYSKTVIGPFGFQFIGRGNDSGLIVPHISFPLINWLLPVTIIFGSSKPMWSASTVQIDVDGTATPMACAIVPLMPLGFNLGCNDPFAFPSDYVFSPNSVIVGMTSGDRVAGLVGIVVDSAVGWLTGKIMGKIMGKGFQLAGKIMKAIGGSTARRMLRGRTLLRMMAQWLKIPQDDVLGVSGQIAKELGQTAMDSISRRDGLEFIKHIKNLDSLAVDKVQDITREWIDSNPEIHEAN